MEQKEIDRLWKRKDNIDMMATAHSLLSHKYQNLVYLFDIPTIIGSVVLLVFVFIDNSFLVQLGISALFSKLVIGLSTIVITSLSVLSTILDFKGKKTSHDNAFNTLVGLKRDWVRFLSYPNDMTNDKAKYLEEKSDLLMAQLTKIDDRQFNKLKQKHLQKVEISKFLSHDPFVPIFIIKFRLMLKDMKQSKSDISSQIEVKEQEVSNA
jgi:hypothetical protein